LGRGAHLLVARTPRTPRRAGRTMAKLKGGRLHARTLNGAGLGAEMRPEFVSVQMRAEGIE
jgi:hypothetical protein